MKTQHIVLSTVEIDGVLFQPAGEGEPPVMAELSPEQAKFLLERGAVSEALGAPVAPKAKGADALRVVSETKA